MNSLQQWVNYSRIITLMLSVLIIFSSLYIYSVHSVPIHSLIDPSRERTRIMRDVIRDRKLIATLIASHASIFCPLFLLMNTYEEKVVSIIFLFEKVFQCIIPIGLAVSWLFCNTFYYNISIALNSEEYWMEHTLRLLVIFFLAIETLLVFIQLPNQIRVAYEGGSIQLYDEEVAIVEKE